MYILSRIDKATKEFLLPPKNTRTSHFYGLPKNHKPDCPPRDIVSGFDGPTDHLSPCVTHFIQPRASNIFLTSLKNSHRFLIHKLPHKEGIAAVIHFMGEYKQPLPTKCPPPHIVCIILDFILKHRTFKSMDMHIHQILGTSMWTRMTPPYANLFQGKEERTKILTFFHLIYFWKRFIDDIFLIFLGSHSRLNSLMTFKNTINPTIKYTVTFSEQTVTFLDVQIYLSKTQTT